MKSIVRHAPRCQYPVEVVNDRISQTTVTAGRAAISAPVRSGSIRRCSIFPTSLIGICTSAGADGSRLVEPTSVSCATEALWSTSVLESCRVTRTVPGCPDPGGPVNVQVVQPKHRNIARRAATDLTKGGAAGCVRCARAPMPVGGAFNSIQSSAVLIRRNCSGNCLSTLNDGNPSKTR